MIKLIKESKGFGYACGLGDIDTDYLYLICTENRGDHQKVVNYVKDLIEEGELDRTMVDDMEEVAYTIIEDLEQMYGIEASLNYIDENDIVDDSAEFDGVVYKITHYFDD